MFLNNFVTLRGRRNHFPVLLGSESETCSQKKSGENTSFFHVFLAIFFSNLTFLTLGDRKNHFDSKMMLETY